MVQDDVRPSRSSLARSHVEPRPARTKNGPVVANEPARAGSRDYPCGMLEWIQQNVQVLSLLANIGMLLIWVAYLQLFFQSFRRQRQPNLLIHQANGFDLNSICMIANMSESNVHIAALLVDAKRGGDSVSFQPAPGIPDPLEDEDPLAHMQEGPLPKGEYFSVGSFRTLVAEASGRLPEPFTDPHADDDEPVMELAVRLVAFVGPELHPIGARRAFYVTRYDDSAEVRPRSLVPEQLSTGRQRKVARQWLKEAQTLEGTHVITYAQEEESIERLQERLEGESGVDREEQDEGQDEVREEEPDEERHEAHEVPPRTRG